MGRRERRAREREGDDPVAQAQIRSNFSNYDPYGPAQWPWRFRGRHKGTSIRSSEAWPFLRLMLVVACAIILGAMVISIATSR
jgi:hypothetical protein